MSEADRILDQLERQSQSSDRPDAKRMRDILPGIEASIARGVSRKRIYQILIDEGFTFTFESFLVTLARLRREAEMGKRAASKVKQVAQAPPLTATPIVGRTGTGDNPLHILSGRSAVGVPHTKFETE